jgi:hypothetical protein
MLAEAFFAKLESASRLLNANQVSFRGCEFRLRIRDIGHSYQFIDVFGRYREYPLSQLSLHLVKERLFGVIAFCLAGEFEVLGRR